MRQTDLERYVPRAVAVKLVTGQRKDLMPVYKELTILFSDIKAFTKWSADKEAKDVHDFLNDYLETMADILFSHNATVDKFMGDGILAFFGDPLDMPNHSAEAIKAALDMQRKVKDLKEKWLPLVGIDLQVRVGINTGNVLVGDLGTRRRIEYTVIGSAVNLAQRMEGLAPPGTILVSDNTKKAAQAFNNNGFTFGPEQKLEVKGYEQTITAFRVIPYPI
jgi:adenylate cyclase